MLNWLKGKKKQTGLASWGDASAKTDVPEGKARVDAGPPAAAPEPGKPWIAIFFSLEDHREVGRVRLFAEAFASEPTRSRDGVRSIGATDDSMVQLLMDERRIEKQGLDIARVARAWVERIASEVAPDMAEVDYVGAAFTTPEGVRQIVIRPGEDGLTITPIEPYVPPVEVPMESSTQPQRLAKG